MYVRKSYSISEYPEELKSKVYLLKHFEKYIMERLYGEYEYTFVDEGRTRGMEWVQKYLRMKHVIVFKMSHDVLQVRDSFLSKNATDASIVQLLRPLQIDFIIARAAYHTYRQALSENNV